jgi:predicted molibdopterin-dependent oxidoreductase YjgC
MSGLPSDKIVGSIEVDGKNLDFTAGETILEVTRRHGSASGEPCKIPTLCYDERLDPFGGCRMCVVELKGSHNPVASCARAAEDGMVIQSSTEGVEKHRKTLLEMLCSENRQVDVDPLSGYASQELKELVDRYDARSGRFAGKKSGKSREDDPNPFILRDYDQCISCYRCVRVCAEQEGDYAISVKGRGFDTQITVEFDGLLKDSACTFCGQCVQTCPTGALADRKALRHADVPGEIEKTRTICTYCGVGCSVDILTKDDLMVGVQPAMDGPANHGALCVKGQFAYDFVQHDERLKTPMVRGADGELHPTSWEVALDKAAQGFLDARDKHGRHSVYAVASGRAPHEASYTTQKFIRSGFWSNHIDNCSRA